MRNLKGYPLFENDEYSHEIGYFWGVAEENEDDGGFDFVLYPLSPKLPELSSGPDTDNWYWWDEEDGDDDTDTEERKEKYLMDHCTTTVYNQVFLVVCDLKYFLLFNKKKNGNWILNYEPPVPSLGKFLKELRADPDIKTIVGIKSKAIGKLATQELYNGIAALPDSMSIFATIRNESPNLWEEFKKYDPEGSEAGADLGGYGF